MLLVYAALTLGVSAVSRALAGDHPDAALTAELDVVREHVAPGMSFETWTIVHVGTPDRGALPIALRRDDGPDLTLAVTRLDPGGPRPLASTARLAVFRAAPGSSDSMTPARELAAAAALAGHLRAREPAAP